MRYLLPLLALLLVGCHGTTGDNPAPRVVVAPTGQATAAQIAAQQAAIDELKGQAVTQRDLAQRASGAVFGANDANGHNPDGLPKEATAAQLSEAASALPAPTAEQQLEKSQQNARILAGELLAVKAEMGQAISENQALRAGLTASEARSAELAKRLADVTAAGEKERAEAAAKLQKQFDAMSAKIGAKDQEISDLKGAWTRNTQMWAARGLVAAGILIVIAGAAIVWISGMAAAGKAAGIALSGLLLIGAGLIVGHKYFLPVAGTALGLMLVASALYVWHIRRTHQLARGMMAAVQDVKDSAAAGSEQAKVAADELKASLLYRFPRAKDGNASALEKEIDRRLVVDGINTQ